MSKLKIVETVVRKEYLHTYLPTGGKVSTTYNILWANTSKGWMFHPMKLINPAHMACFQAKVISAGSINPKNWSVLA